MVGVAVCHGPNENEILGVTAMAIILTDTAAGEIKRYMDEQKVDEGAVLRVGVAGGGCSGLQYTLGFATDFDPKVDARYEQHGVAMVTSKKMALHLDGTTIDFKEGPMGRGFSIDNPNVPRGGGCPGCGHH
jgi:iron-sulfur cluster assembly protein